jgi:hypothetical protein
VLLPSRDRWPSEINTLEKLIAWAGSYYAKQCGSLRVPWQSEKRPVANVKSLRAADDSIRLIVEASVPLSPGWQSDRTLKLWDRAGEAIQGRFAPLYWVAPGATFEGDAPPPPPPSTRTTAEAETLITQLVSQYGAVSRTLTFGSFSQSQSWHVVTINTASSGTMRGTPWGSGFTNNSLIGRVILHSLDSASAYSFLQTNSLRVLLRTVGVGTQSSYTSLNRNGYTSASYGSFTGVNCNQIIYYSQSLNNLVTVNPLTQSTPVVFDP